MFWTKQAFWTSVFVFVVAVLVPYLVHPLLWLFTIAFVLLTWVYYNNPVDETRRFDNRFHDFRPMCATIGVLFFAMGYFQQSEVALWQSAVAFGLGLIVLPLIVVEACQPAEAERRGYKSYQVGAMFFTPFACGFVALVSWMLNLHPHYWVPVLCVGLFVQILASLVRDYRLYSNTHATPWPN